MTYNKTHNTNCTSNDEKLEHKCQCTNVKEPQKRQNLRISDQRTSRHIGKHTTRQTPDGNWG